MELNDGNWIRFVIEKLFQSRLENKSLDWKLMWCNYLYGVFKHVCMRVTNINQKVQSFSESTPGTYVGISLAAQQTELSVCTTYSSL